MAKQHLYTLTLACDDGHQAKIDLLVGHKPDLTYLLQWLVYGKQFNESFDVEPEPFGKADDLRSMLERRDAL